MENQVAQSEFERDQADTINDMSYRMSNPKLAALRAQNPFLAILPFPNSTLTFTLASNVPLDVNLPEGTKFMYISGSDEYYISRQGTAKLPSAVGTAMDRESGAYQNPEGFFVYCEEIRQFSIVAQNANTRVSVAIYQQL